MLALSALLLCWFPLIALAGQIHKVSSMHRTRHNNLGLQTRAKTYKLVDKHQGASFFEGWNFFTGADPTHGNVEFMSQKQATSKGLAYVQRDNTTILAVDSTSTVPVGGNRNSVRISSKKSYNSGLFIADFWAMPHGCGVWPSWWSVGPNWPQAGEIDIVEAVNKMTTNQYTLHSGSGSSCTLDRSVKTNSSNILGTQCESKNGANAGCAFADTDTRTFGPGFNKIAGGVFAHLWDSTGIKIWQFPRGEIPNDIMSGNPNPASWPAPKAAWLSSSCDISSHFYEHTLTIDTTICGDWANGAYASSGCPGTCAQAVADPKNFAFAKWEINYIAVYQ